LITTYNIKEKKKMKDYIEKVVSRQNLTEEEARGAMKLMLEGEATQAQIAAFLTALRMKGETLDELVGLASVLRDKADTISPKCDNYVDLVGTGGDRTFTFNISTTSSFVVAAAGLPVAKHGNRSISSKSGAGDVLEALGVNIMAEPELVQKCVEEVGIGFMFAQLFNKSMKYVGQARKEMGIRTVFNILGPLANPSRAKNMVVGVYDPALTERIAEAMSRLGVERALVVSGCDNMDEITLTGETTVSEIKAGKVATYKITPEQFGLKRAGLEELRGGDGAANAVITKDILQGKERGAKRDIVLLNAGATLYTGGVASSIADGVKLAAETIDSGKAYEKLEELVRVSNQ
jgi:anthranilate phosphoribosyltransferase